MWDLKSGDIFIKDSNTYSDYREQLITWDEYEREKYLYGKQVNLPVESNEFIKDIKDWLALIVKETDDSFLHNQLVSIENGKPLIRKSRSKQKSKDLKKIQNLIIERLTPINILDILSDTEYWTNWTRNFSSISGNETKLENPQERYIITTFCYGCNLGPTQTSRSLETDII